MTGKRARSLRDRRVAIVVDHPARDLAGLVLVASELCRRGVVCHLVPLNRQDAEVWALRPDFVLLNFFRRGANEDFGRNLLRAGIPFGLLDTEGGVWPSEASYTEILWKDRQLLRAARCACMWGPRLAKHLVASGVFDTRQVRVTGCARFDLYHSQWRGIFGVGGRGEDRPRILINTNYSTVNSRFVTADQNKTQLEEMGWAAEHARETVEKEAKAQNGMIDLAEALSRRFLAATVVVRPHPFENPEPYRLRLHRLPNVEVNETGPVQIQIQRASVVVQRSCTTALEATLASVPALSPLWIEPAYENPMAEEVSIPCESLETLSGTVRQILDGRSVASAELAKRRRQVIHDWFFEADGRAHRRVTDAIGECLTEVADIDTALCRRFLYGVPKHHPRPIGSRLRHTLRLSPHWSFRKMRTVVPSLRPEKTFAAADVKTLVKHVADLRAKAGERARPLSVSLARENGEYSDGFRGDAVTLRAS